MGTVASSVLSLESATIKSPTVPSRLPVAVVVPSSPIESATNRNRQRRQAEIRVTQRFPDRRPSLTKSVPPKSSKNNRQLAIADRNARERRGDHLPADVSGNAYWVPSIVTAICSR